MGWVLLLWDGDGMMIPSHALFRLRNKAWDEPASKEAPTPLEGIPIGGRNSPEPGHAPP